MRQGTGNAMGNLATAAQHCRSRCRFSLQAITTLPPPGSHSSLASTDRSEPLRPLSKYRGVIAALVVAVLVPALLVSHATSALADTRSQVASIANGDPSLGLGPCNSGSTRYGQSCYDATVGGWCADFAWWVWNQAGLDVAGITGAAI